MYVQVEKSIENKSRSVANTIIQKKSYVKQAFDFADIRSDVASHRKLQKLFYNSKSKDPVQKKISMASEWQKFAAKGSHEEAEIAALKTAYKYLPILQYICESDDEMISVTIREGVHQDFRDGREASPHQTIDINVKGRHWSYHLMMAPANPIGWTCTSVELQSQGGELPKTVAELIPAKHIIL